MTVTEKFLMEKRNNTLPDPGIEPRTSTSSAVALTTTRPTRQSVSLIYLEDKQTHTLLFADLKNKKTVLYAVGFFDSSAYPFSQAIGTAYSKRGYNVFLSETIAFLTNIYPK